MDGIDLIDFGLNSLRVILLNVDYTTGRKQEFLHGVLERLWMEVAWYRLNKWLKKRINQYSVIDRLRMIKKQRKNILERYTELWSKRYPPGQIWIRSMARYGWKDGRKSAFYISIQSPWFRFVLSIWGFTRLQYECDRCIFFSCNFALVIHSLFMRPSNESCCDVMWGWCGSGTKPHHLIISSGSFTYARKSP